jgi:hypothetical protein
MRQAHIIGGRGAANDLPAAADGDDKAAASAKKWHPRLRIQILCRRVREALLADFQD